MFTNYEYTRNDPILLNSLGFIQPRNRLSEKKFLQSLFRSDLSKLTFSSTLASYEENLEPKHLPTLVIVMGGFLDMKHGGAYKLCSLLRESTVKNESFHLFYREHDEAADARRLVEYYAKYGCKIILIGHSWGGSSIIMHVARKVVVSIDLIVTLDPVGILRPRRILRNVSRWLNVYVDYKKASYEKYNNVARIGLAWQYCPTAQENIASAILKHHKACEIFALYCMEEFQCILQFD